MSADRTAALNPNAKIFLAVFLFIAGVVGVVLAVINASSQPVATTPAVIYGAAGVLFLVAGFVLIRKRRY